MLRIWRHDCILRLDVDIPLNKVKSWTIQQPAWCKTVIRLLACMYRYIKLFFGGSKRDEVTEDWRRLNNEELNPLTPNDTYNGRTAPLTSKVAFYIFIQQIQVLNILNMVYTLRLFSSKFSLFHNSNVFGSCIIHILYTGRAKIKKIIPAPKG